MQANVVKYLDYTENRRANLAKEKENNRANLAREAETYRANRASEEELKRSHLADETERNRANLAREFETNRSNVESELLKRAQNQETRRANLKKEGFENLRTQSQLAVDNQNIYESMTRGAKNVVESIWHPVKVVLPTFTDILKPARAGKSVGGN